ncbi:MAG: hypothetical protein AMXMBFR13_00270 [Phycisphaerae bacterium]
MRNGMATAGAVLLVSALVGPVYAQSNCEQNRATISATRGIVFESANVQQGQWYWKLVEVAWCNENQAGGKINIFYRCKDASGQLIANQKCIAAYPLNQSNQVTISTKAPPDWGDFPMSGGNWCPFWPEGPRGPFSAWVDSFCPANGSSCPPQASYPSDKVIGMGLPCNRHECYFLTWQFTQMPALNPTISRSPSSFVKTVGEGGTLPNDSFTVQNTGGGTLTYSMTDNADWLSVSPSSGASTGEVDTINVIYDVDELSPDEYNATITISAPGATNTPQTIPIQLTVTSPRYLGDFDEDLDVDLEDFGHFQLCLTGPGVIQSDSECADTRLDHDPDVDQEDFGIFQACLSGANRRPPDECRR